MHRLALGLAFLGLLASAGTAAADPVTDVWGWVGATQDFAEGMARDLPPAGLQFVEEAVERVPRDAKDYVAWWCGNLGGASGQPVQCPVV